jgi:hypothetical protein
VKFNGRSVPKSPVSRQNEEENTQTKVRPPDAAQRPLSRPLAKFAWMLSRDKETIITNDRTSVADAQTASIMEWKVIDYPERVFPPPQPAIK